MAAKHARALNIHCEITVNVGVLGLGKRKMVIMPTPPADPKPAAPEAAPEARKEGDPFEAAKPETPKKEAKPRRGTVVEDDPSVSAFAPD